MTADVPVVEVVAVDAVLDALDTPTSSEVYSAVEPFSNSAVAAAAAARAIAGGGGGSQPVTCLLARDAAFDIHDVGAHDVLWDALYDTFWDLNPLLAIPAGLGLTFAFDGSSSLIVPTEAGVWSFSYSGVREGDTTWSGYFVVGGVDVRGPWLQAAPSGIAVGVSYLNFTLCAAQPAGTQLTHQVITETIADEDPSNVNQVYLSIVRLA